MQDVINRSLIIPANSNIESIKPVTWNDCRSAGIDSPTPIPRGTCANISLSGWQMRVRSGAIRYTYYVQSNLANIEDLPAPDVANIKPLGLDKANISLIKGTLLQLSPNTVPSCSIFKNGELNGKNAERAFVAIFRRIFK